MTDDTRPKRHTIAEQIRNGERDPVEDADKTNHDPPNLLTFVHLARDGSITVTYTLEKTLEGTEAGQIIEFDLLDSEGVDS